MRLAIAFACWLVAASAAPRGEPAQIRVPLWASTPEPVGPSQLSIEVNGRPAQLVELQGPEDELLILLVLDLVADLNEIELAKEALLRELEQLPDHVYVAVLRAQDGPQVLLDPTNDHGRLREVIRSYAARGAPALLSTIELTSRLADSIVAKAPVRLAILYVTDSDIYAYREDLTNPVINWSDQRDLSRVFNEGIIRDRIARLEHKLSACQTPIFIVHLEYKTERLNEAYQNGLLRLAAVTGGQARFCRSNSDIAVVIHDTFQIIRSHYVACVQVPEVNNPNLEIALKAEGIPLQYRTRMRYVER